MVIRGGFTGESAAPFPRYGHTEKTTERMRERERERSGLTLLYLYGYILEAIDTFAHHSSRRLEFVLQQINLAQLYSDGQYPQ